MVSDGAYMVVSAMRDEGAFLLEWLCWYRLAGFGALVLTNDCTDSSPALLDCLAEAGWVTHLPHDPGPEPAKRSAHRTALAHPVLRRAEWALVCDVDEFVMFHVGHGTIDSYLAETGFNCRAIALNWRCFGHGGVRSYADSPVHRQFLQAARPQNRTNTNFKTLFHHPRRWSALGAHVPRGFEGTWGEGRNHLVDAAGRPVEDYHPETNAVIRTRPLRITHATAQMNHYILRSPEGFALKMGTASASRGVDRYTEAFRVKYDRNEERDDRALTRRAGFDRLWAQAMALPGVAGLHHLCCAQYVARLARKQGREARDDPRWHHHMERADRAS